jgi:hypothetical protein
LQVLAEQLLHAASDESPRIPKVENNLSSSIDLQALHLKPLKSFSLRMRNSILSPQSQHKYSYIGIQAAPRGISAIISFALTIVKQKIYAYSTRL